MKEFKVKLGSWGTFNVLADSYKEAKRIVERKIARQRRKEATNG